MNTRPRPGYPGHSIPHATNRLPMSPDERD